MDEILRQSLIAKFAAGESSLYDVLYFYGAQEETRAMVDALIKEYEKKHPSARIRRTNAGSFVEETISAFRAENSDFVSAPACDLFVFEQIEGIAGMEVTQERLYGILDRLLENKRKIIISGARPTAQITKLAPRIRAQIDGGIAWCAV